MPGSKMQLTKLMTLDMGSFCRVWYQMQAHCLLQAAQVQSHSGCFPTLVETVLAGEQPQKPPSKRKSACCCRTSLIESESPSL